MEEACCESSEIGITSIYIDASRADDIVKADQYPAHYPPGHSVTFFDDPAQPGCAFFDTILKRSKHFVEIDISAFWRLMSVAIIYTLI